MDLEERLKKVIIKFNFFMIAPILNMSLLNCNMVNFHTQNLLNKKKEKKYKNENKVEELGNNNVKNNF